jgi:hypothetical protein
MVCHKACHKVTCERTDNQLPSLGIVVGIDDVTETLIETLRRWSFPPEASTVNPDGVGAACSRALVTVSNSSITRPDQLNLR